ncbi:MAG: tetratricopeptide repeat protein [Phascolarctobacterium sp.]|nr:tetratricopeptide repeat protein [Phascolarctobacterium sp.]
MDINEILKKSDQLFISDRPQDGAAYLEKCLKDVSGEEEECTIKLPILNELMGYYRSITQLETAWEYALEAERIIDEYHLESNIASVTTDLNIANLYRAGGEVKKALDLYKKVEKIYQDEGLTDDRRVGGVYNNISVACMELRDMESAVKYGEKAIEAIKNLPGSADERITIYGNLAGALLQAKEPDFKKIEGYLDQAKELFENECPQSGHYGAVLGMMGYVCFRQRDLAGAIKKYEEAAEETKKHYGENADYKRVMATLDQLNKLAKK